MNYYTYGTIVSPGFPSQYGNSLNCTYILQVAQGSVVRLNFETYTLASYDAISIYDGLNEGSPLVYILTGSFDPNNHVFQSTGPYMAVRFLSDSILTAQGFLATFNGVITTGPPATPRPTTTSRPSTIPARKCADGWVHDSYEMYCYKYFPNGLSWDQSLQTCGSQGSQLLTVHDRQQEMDVLDFIRSNQGSLTSRVWIGLKKSFGNWAWSDGTSVSYLAFLPGEPSSAGNCAAAQGYTNPSGWVALDCSTALPFICYHNALSKL
ncbi:hypothetical protein FO519_008472 [Halicephalobus sp. NKZ332]|nr:hypothetical protein FO519_008472 [Halicephalobus sp. NKZ332]